VAKDGILAGVTHIHVPVTADHERCQLRHVLDRVGDKWSVLVMALLGSGPRHEYIVESRRRYDASTPSTG
jgi:hypothetical protein